MKFFKHVVISCCLIAVLGGLAVAQEGDATQRADIEDRYKWKLTNMYPTQEAYDADFATVEADLTEINLTHYETFYPEKRLYFIEGAELYS